MRRTGSPGFWGEAVGEARYSVNEVCKKSWHYTMASGQKQAPPKNILLILTHHLKGLSLSFQKIIKLTLLDQRNWSYSRSKMLYLTLGICNSPFSVALWLLAVVSLPLVLWGTQWQPWEWRGRNWVCLHLTETNGSAPCNTHCSADDLWWWWGGGGLHCIQNIGKPAT